MITNGRPMPTREAILHAAWTRAAEHGAVLHARTGESYRVIYPGRHTGGAGPDFKDAVLVRSDGATVRGDIEIHVRPGGWRAHGHGTDARYNGVAFHVTLEDRDGPDTLTASGMRVPLLAIGPVLQAAHMQRRVAAAVDAPQDRRRRAGQPGSADVPGSPAAVTGQSEARATLTAWQSPPGLPDIALDAAGDQRFHARSDGFMMELRASPPDQVLYAAVLECLGYSENRKGFRQLANRLPWTLLARPDPGRQTAEALAPLMLWAAGLGPRPAGAPPLGGHKPEWTLPGGRPDNRPNRRIAGAAALAAGWLTATPAGGPAAALATLITSAEHGRHIAGAFITPGRDGERALIGAGRAAEIAAAVLPAMHAVGRFQGDAALMTRCSELFAGQPKLPENAITREVRKLLSAAGRPAVTPGAREQQGLVFLYRAMSPAVARPV